jgi:hypothetical protein
MNTLLKFVKNHSLLYELSSRSFSFQSKSLSGFLIIDNIFFNQQNRSNYTFSLNNRQQLIRYRRATRPKKTNDDSLMLTYEQSQFAENLGITKSWTTWNTCNLIPLY